MIRYLLELSDETRGFNLIYQNHIDLHEHMKINSRLSINLINYATELIPKLPDNELLCYLETVAHFDAKQCYSTSTILGGSSLDRY